MDTKTRNIIKSVANMTPEDVDKIISITPDKVVNQMNFTQSHNQAHTFYNYFLYNYDFMDAPRHDASSPRGSIVFKEAGKRYFSSQTYHWLLRDLNKPCATFTGVDKTFINWYMKRLLKMKLIKIVDFWTYHDVFINVENNYLSVELTKLGAEYYKQIYIKSKILYPEPNISSFLKFIKSYDKSKYQQYHNYVCYLFHYDENYRKNHPYNCFG